MEKENIDKEQRRCEIKKTFDGLNDWQVVKLETSKNDDIDEGDLVKEIIHGIECRMSEKIMKDNYGTMITDDLDTDGYYIVEWDSNVYTAHDDIVIKGYSPPEYVYAGEMVCKTRFWNPVSKAKYWYIPMPEGEGDTILRMKQVLMVDI